MLEAPVAFELVELTVAVDLNVEHHQIVVCSAVLDPISASVVKTVILFSVCSLLPPKTWFHVLDEHTRNYKVTPFFARFDRLTFNGFCPSPMGKSARNMRGVLLVL